MIWQLHSCALPVSSSTVFLGQLEWKTCNSDHLWLPRAGDTLNYYVIFLAVDVLCDHQQTCFRVCLGMGLNGAECMWSLVSSFLQLLQVASFPTCHSEAKIW